MIPCAFDLPPARPLFDRNFSDRVVVYRRKISDSRGIDDLHFVHEQVKLLPIALQSVNSTRKCSLHGLFANSDDKWSFLQTKHTARSEIVLSRIQFLIHE
jgi:hypothetical protein